MSLEFIGHTGSRSGAETIEASGPIIDKAYIKHMAHTAEANGFDRLLIGSFATWPDNNQIAAYVLHNTARLGVMLAHRPGFVAPTVAAQATGDAGPVQRRTAGGARDQWRYR